MTFSDMLVREFEREARTTRRHLERLPADKLDWAPHAKSFTARQLGSHIVDCVRWGEPIFGGDEFEIDPATYKPYRAPSVEDLLATFDDDVGRCTRAMTGADDAAIMRPWRLRMRGKVRVDSPKAAAFRDFTLSHLIHHRGQLSVYLRLLGVPVPGSYGPTADDQR